MRMMLKITTITLVAFMIFSGCSGSSKSPVIPDKQNADAVPVADLSNVQGGDLLLWMYDVTIDPVSLTWEMELIKNRNAGAIGDSYEIEIGKFLTGFWKGIECQDCLRIQNIGLHGNGDIWLDIGLRHPFDLQYRLTKRADLDVFDPRVILIVDGTDNRFVQTNGVGTDNEPISGNFNFLKNADGYTNHFDNRAEIPEFIGTPRNYQGNLNPFKYFFVDTDTDALIFGKENPEHRMRMGSQTDVQRFRIANPGGGSTFSFVMAVEVSYVQAATLFTRLSPVYHVPEGNQKEAYRITTNLPRTIIEGDVNPLSYNVFVEDWQNTTPIGPLPIQVRAMSDVKRVTVEIPGVSSALGNQMYPASGGGIMYNPYVFNFIMPLDQSPTAAGSPYLALIAVEDDLNDILRADYYYNSEPLDDFVAYKIIPVNVIPVGTPPAITIYNYAVDWGKGTCVISGQIMYLDATSNVTLTHNTLTYPMYVDFDGTFAVTVVLIIGPNTISIDATNSFGADNASIPLINYSPIPLPAFRITLYWEPTVADPLDSTDMDLHLWNTSDVHCFYDNKMIDNAVLTIDDADGYGPENIDGRLTSGVLPDGFYPVAVNYYSNHRGILTHSIQCTVRVLLNPGTMNETTNTYNFTLSEEDYNSSLHYPVTVSTNSWYRVVDIGVVGNVAAVYVPDTSHNLPY